jgi:hypothetical protein
MVLALEVGLITDHHIRGGSGRRGRAGGHPGHGFDLHFPIIDLPPPPYPTSRYSVYLQLLLP